MATGRAAIPPQHDVILTTPRLRLRAVQATDLGAMHKMRLDPDVMRYMPAVETEPVAEKSRSVERIGLMMQAGMFSFAVLVPSLPPSDLEGEGEVIGFLGITSPPQIFYIFARSSWGRGYATEALGAFLEGYWARFPRGLVGVSEGDVGGDVLEARVDVGNKGSEGVLRKCGFEVAGEGVMVAHGVEVKTRVFRLERPG